MKKKKLVLKKNTITNLNRSNLVAIRGGNKGDPYETFVVNGCSWGICSEFCSNGCGGGGSYGCTDMTNCHQNTCDCTIGAPTCHVCPDSEFGC